MGSQGRDNRRVAKRMRVEDRDDPRLADYVSLRDVQLRKQLEAEHGLFIAEGEKVVRRAVEAGYPARSFLLSERWLGGLTDVLAAAGDVPCYVASEALVEQVTGFHVHRGALAAMERLPAASVDSVIGGARRLVVLEDIVDHANVGAILRSATALGADGALLSPRCADPLYRRAVKVSMGAVFALPWTRLPDWYDALPKLAAVGFVTVALTPAAGALDVRDLQERLAGSPTAVIVGSEGHGLTRRWIDSAQLRARIPMSNGIDSLNVAAAAAVAFHALW